MLVWFPENAFKKFKKIYRKSDSKKRAYKLVLVLSYMPHNSNYWITRAIRELPKKETKPLRDLLKSQMVQPFTNEEILHSIKEDFANTSPNKRISAMSRLQYLSDTKNKKTCK